MTAPLTLPRCESVAEYDARIETMRAEVAADAHLARLEAERLLNRIDNGYYLPRIAGAA